MTPPPDILCPGPSPPPYLPGLWTVLHQVGGSPAARGWPALLPRTLVGCPARQEAPRPRPRRIWVRRARARAPTMPVAGVRPGPPRPTWPQFSGRRHLLAERSLFFFPSPRRVRDETSVLTPETRHSGHFHPRHHQKFLGDQPRPSAPLPTPPPPAKVHPFSLLDLLVNLRPFPPPFF